MVYSMLLTGVLRTFKVFWVVSDCPEIHVTHRLRGRKGEEEEELGRMKGLEQEKRTETLLLISSDLIRGLVLRR